MKERIFYPFSNDQLAMLKGATVKSVTLDAVSNRFEIEFFGGIKVSCRADVVDINVPSDFFEVKIIDPVPVRR